MHVESVDREVTKETNTTTQTIFSFNKFAFIYAHSFFVYLSTTVNFIFFLYYNQ